MNLLIREAVESDAESIWKLNQYEMGYHFPLDAAKVKLSKLIHSEDDRIYVALVDDDIIGYVHANSYDLLYAPHMKNIMGIAVASQYRHNGIGTALLQHVEMWAIKDGAAGVRLVSGASRHEAHAFYHKCGYSGDKEQLNLKKVFHT